MAIERNVDIYLCDLIFRRPRLFSSISSICGYDSVFKTAFGGVKRIEYMPASSVSALRGKYGFAAEKTLKAVTRGFFNANTFNIVVFQAFSSRDAKHAKTDFTIDPENRSYYFLSSFRSLLFMK